MKEFYQSKQNPEIKVRIKHLQQELKSVLGMVSLIKPDTFIELGTFEGGLTLALHERFPDLRIFSFDKENLVSVEVFNLCNPDRVVFVQEDILFKESTFLVGLLSPFSLGRKFLYCDNGDKIKEVNMYVKYLSKGDIIGVHDWETEISSEDVEDLFEKLGFDSSYHDVYQVHKNKFWEKTF